MTTKVDFDSLVKWLLLCGWIALFIGGVIHYAGSCLIYTMFSVVFLTMLISGFYRKASYGYLFLVVFLWLGFWLKLTVHAIFNYSFGEPFGSFNGTAAAWDEVLWVAIVASMGVVMGRILYRLAGGKSTILIPEGSAGAPVWYPMIRKWLWLSLLAAVVGLASLNIALGIQQSGLVPRTILPWPLNAVIYWMLGKCSDLLDVEHRVVHGGSDPALVGYITEKDYNFSDLRHSCGSIFLFCLIVKSRCLHFSCNSADAVTLYE